MKLHFSLIALFAANSQAFSLNRMQHNNQKISGRCTSKLFSDFGSAMPENVSPYERIGIQDGELAIGIDPNDVITYLGTREDLIDKALADVSSFDRSQAETEISKFLLDAEALQVFIEFQKRKAEDPDFEVPSAEKEEEGFFSFRTLVIVYLIYVASQTLPNILKDFVLKKEAAGEWSGSGIPFIDQWLSQSSAVDVDALAQSVGDSVQTVVDNLN